MTPRRVVVLGDLAGDDRYHVGDEAMTEATIDVVTDLLVAAGEVPPIIVVASADPDATTARYGCTAVPWSGFAGRDTDTERDDLLTTLTGSTPSKTSARSSPTAHSALLAQVAGADALVIAGGGNLNSHWPHHLYERLAAARVASASNVPVVITGQTLGPHLTDAHLPRLAELLGLAAVVGVRERHSHELALRLGVDPARLLDQVDDAAALVDRRPDADATAVLAVRSIAVTLHPFHTADDARMLALADQLATVADRLSARLVFVPHMHDAEGPEQTSDVVLAAALADRTGGVALDRLDARGAAWVARHAWLVVSSRYHPIVFAALGDVPSLALLWDDYTAVKCRGALEHVGCGDWWIDVEGAEAGKLTDALGELARRRTEVSSWMASNRADLEELEVIRRNRLAAALGWPAASTTPSTAVVGWARPWRADEPRPAGRWALGRR